MAAEVAPTGAVQPGPQAGRETPWSAVLWMVGALLSFSAMAIAGREISKELTTSQLMFYRSVIGFLIILIVALGTRRGLGQFRTRDLKTHFLRNLLHFVGQYGWFYAIVYIPLAEVFAIEFTSPLWVAILAPFVLGERFSALRGIGIVVGFAGILVITRPGLESVNQGTIAMVIGAIGFAASTLATKKLSGSETALTVLFYMALIQAPIGLVLSLDGFAFPSAMIWAWLVVVTFFGLSAHFCLTRAYRLAEVTFVAPMDYLRLPLIALVGMLLYGEPVEIWLLIGGVLILAGNYLNLRARRNGR